MRILAIVIAAMVLTGCTMYKVKSTAPGGKEISVLVMSSRQFEAPDLEYERQGADAKFKIGRAHV